LLRVEECAKVLDIGRTTTFELVRAGAFGRPVRIGRLVRIPRENLQAFLDRQAVS
jgi:excisionase family DNA binding protein